jgi:uncharacterized membrane protein YbhN (UPF0104 family)
MFVSKLLRVVVSVVLLACVAWKTNWSNLAAAFASLRLELWLAAVATFGLAQVTSAWRWRLLARALGFAHGLKQLIGFYFIGTYFNLLLPTSVGGDVVRVYYLDAGSRRRLPAFLSVFLDRLSGLLVLLGLACLGVLLSPVHLVPWVVWSVWGITAGALIGMVTLPLLAGWFKLGQRRVEQIRAALRLLRDPRLFVQTTLLSAVVQSLNVVLVWLVGLAVDAQVPASFYWIMVPMVSLLTMLPISVNGMGVREMSTALLLAPLGVSQDLALSLAVLWFAANAAVSLVGGIVYYVGRFLQTVPDGLGNPSDSAEVQEDHGSIDHHPNQGRTRQPRQAA